MTTFPPSVKSVFPNGQAGRPSAPALYDHLEALAVLGTINQLGLVTHRVKTLTARDKLLVDGELTAGQSMVWVFDDPSHTDSVPVNGFYFWDGVEFQTAPSLRIDDVSQITGEFQAFVDAKTAEITAAANGFDAEAAARLDKLGYLLPVAFASGLVVNTPRFQVARNGALYIPNPQRSGGLPFTTTATFTATDWLERPNQQSLAQAISDLAVLTTRVDQVEADTTGLAEAGIVHPPFAMRSNIGANLPASPNLDTDGNVSLGEVALPQGGFVDHPTAGRVALPRSNLLTPFEGGTSPPANRFWVAFSTTAPATRFTPSGVTPGAADDPFDGAHPNLFCLTYDPNTRELRAHGNKALGVVYTPPTDGNEDVVLFVGRMDAVADRIGDLTPLYTFVPNASQAPAALQGRGPTLVQPFPDRTIIARRTFTPIDVTQFLRDADYALSDSELSLSLSQSPATDTPQLRLQVDTDTGNQTGLIIGEPSIVDVYEFTVTLTRTVAGQPTLSASGSFMLTATAPANLNQPVQGDPPSPPGLIDPSVIGQFDQFSELV